AIDAQHQARWPAYLIALADHSAERQRRPLCQEPAAEIGAGRTRGRLFRNRSALRKEEAGAHAAPARVREHVGEVAVLVHAAVALQQREDWLAARHRLRR